MDRSNLTGKGVVLVTGCSSGFGRLIAETLARKGYRVFAAIRAARGRNAGRRARASRTGGTRVASPARARTRCHRRDASVDRAVEDVTARAGRIDILINNAVRGRDASQRRGVPRLVWGIRMEKDRLVAFMQRPPLRPGVARQLAESSDVFHTPIRFPDGTTQPAPFSVLNPLDRDFNATSHRERTHRCPSKRSISAVIA